MLVSALAQAVVADDGGFCVALIVRLRCNGNWLCAHGKFNGGFGRIHDETTAPPPKAQCLHVPDEGAQAVKRTTRQGAVEENVVPHCLLLSKPPGAPRSG